MNQPVLHNLSKILSEPEGPENAAILSAYRASKEALESRRAEVLDYLDNLEGRKPEKRPRI